MNDLLTLSNILYYILYGSVSVLSLLAGLYILLRRGNAFSFDITPPLRLRRIAAAFFLSLSLAHIWWLLLYYIQPTEQQQKGSFLSVLIDMVIVFPMLSATMHAMLQDRKRPIWPIFAIMAVILCWLAICMIFHIDFFHYSLFGCIFLILSFSIFMSIALRQYGRWLRDNYADLEHKEVWQVFWMLLVLIILIIFYSFANGNLLIDIMGQIIEIMMIMLLLWRIETLPTLRESTDPVQDTPDDVLLATSDVMNPLFDKLESLLQEHCVEKQYYLNHNVTLTQLAKHIGTNRQYLSQHFAKMGLTYNSYINGLRIEHFILLYDQAVAEHRPVTARQLASECGFHRYGTFSDAFKQCKGVTVAEWMHQHSASRAS